MVFIDLCYNIPARLEAKVTALSLGTGHNAEAGGDLWRPPAPIPRILMALRTSCAMNWHGSGAACDVLLTHMCLRCYTDFQARPMRVLRAFLLQEALLCPTDPQTFSRVPTCYLIPDFAQFSYSLNCLDTSKCILHKVEKSQGKTRVFFIAHINSYHSRNIFSLHSSALLFNTEHNILNYKLPPWILLVCLGEKNVSLLLNRAFNIWTQIYTGCPSQHCTLWLSFSLALFTPKQRRQNWVLKLHVAWLLYGL